MREKRFGWSSDLADFLVTDGEKLARALQTHHEICMGQPASASQCGAWQAFLSSLQRQCKLLVDAYPSAGGWALVLEFELPRERGRRPDLIILAEQTVYVVEFKNSAHLTQAHVDQVLAYARDLKHYHAASHNLEVIPILATSSLRKMSVRDGAHVCGIDDLAKVILDLHVSADSQIDRELWVSAEYAPLPSLVDAARRIFLHEELPHIRRAASAGVGEAVQQLLLLSAKAEKYGEHHLVLVTGVPGAGKTLVGIQFVYSQQFSETGTERPAIFLSGNGPLVAALQHALKSGAFVRDVHGFLKEHGGKRGSAPREQIWVYDEAQRAWDQERVKEKREGGSEPEDFLSMGSRKDWALMVGLIGEGQEIHIGEEAGLGQWNDAISTVGGDWTVHSPSKIAGLFKAATSVISDDRLDLTVSLRSHLAEHVQSWVTHLLRGELVRAAELSQSIREQGFQMYLSRDLDQLKYYVKDRYEEAADKRYGLLASSRDRCLPVHGVQNGYNWTRNLKFGPWYNDPPDSKDSCCQLTDVATEFACQGLELDFPIVAWGDDLFWADDHWESKPQPRSSAHNPHQLRINSYRVLLTRGRDGFAIFVPKHSSLEKTCDALRMAGVRLVGS